MSHSLASGSRASSSIAALSPVNATSHPVNVENGPTSTPVMGAVGPPVATTVMSYMETDLTALPEPSPSTSTWEEPSLLTFSSSQPPPPPVTSATPTLEATTTTDTWPITTSSAPSSSSPSSPSSFFSIPVIIGIAVGAAAILLIVAGGCWFLGRSRRRRSRRDMEDDTLGTFRPPKNRRERPARAGYARHADGMPSQTHIPAPPPFQPPRAGLSRDEARASVQMFDRSAVPVPTPPRPFDDSATFQTTSAWTDNSEMDVFAVDGSSYARTLSTVSRPNSEYDLEDGPGAIYVPHNNSTIIDPFAIYSQTDLRTPPPIGYPPLQSSPSGTFGRTTPQAWRDAPPSNGVPIRGVVMPVGGVVPVPLGGVVAPAPSQMALPGPSRRPDGRIPAPRLLVDTKAPFDAVPLSAVNGAMSSGPLSTMPTPLSALGGWSSGVPTPFDHTPSTARALSPETTFAPPSRSTSRGAAFNPVPTASTFTSGPSSSAYPVPSAAYAAGPSYGTRPLVTRHGSRSDDRPSALPYADNEAPGLTRGPTIIRHADGGAFNDAIPNEQGEVHLPPAYDEIYAPNP